MTEEQFQQQCFLHAWNHPSKFFRYRIFTIHNNAKDARQGLKLKSMGVLSGVPDMCILLNDRKVIWIELKKDDKQTLSPSQKKLHPIWEEFNHPVFVINKFDDFELLINEILKVYGTTI